MSGVTILNAGTGATLQDEGWQGTLALGLSQGGIADRRAYADAAALLGHVPGAVLEMAGMGVTLRAEGPCRIALTGAQMRADVDGTPLLWRAVHALEAGQVLTIGAALGGVYGLLAFGGGIDAPRVLGSRSTHRATGLGQVVAAGDRLELRDDPQPARNGLKLPDISPSAAPIRMVPTAQTGLFPEAVIAEFEATEFARALRGNRQGVALDSAARFALEGGQSIVSETALPGDIQLPGDGVPVVLLADCQTTGGYPRLASILPCDLHRVVQAQPGDRLRFKMISREAGLEAERAEFAARRGLAAQAQPILRDPAQMQDLLSYQLISGVIAGDEEKGA